MASPSAPTSSRLVCSICLSLFTTPKILPCIHTFCQNCLEQLVARLPPGAARILKCPTCRRETPVPDRGVAGFQENFYITDELEARRARDKEMCVLHRDRQVTEICTPCDVFICDDCKDTQHDGHATLTFINEIAAARRELSDLMKELEDNSSALKSALTRMSDDEGAAVMKIESYKNGIDKRIKVWRTLIDKLRAEAFRKLDMHTSVRRGKSQNAALQVQKHQQATAVLLEQTRSALNDGRGISVLAATRKIKPDRKNHTKNVIKQLEKSCDQPSLEMNSFMDDVDEALCVLSGEGLLNEKRGSGSSSRSHRAKTDDESGSDEDHRPSSSPRSQSSAAPPTPNGMSFQPF